MKHMVNLKRVKIAMIEVESKVNGN